MKYFLVIIITLFSFSMQAQPLVLKVDCGNDTVFCPRLYPDTLFHIGTRTKILNGNAPYTYQWSCKWKSPYSNYILTASDFLNDTNILNPYIKTLLDVNICFHLTVIDKDNNIANDSIFVNSAKFSYSTFEYSFFLHLGDSLQFFNDIFVGGGFPPVKYYWTPSVGLNDSTKIDAWCKPQKSTDYYQYIIDSAGCKSQPNRVYNIYVLPTSIETSSYNPRNLLNLYLNGVKLIFNNPQNKLTKLSIYSIDGKIVYSAETNNSFFDIHHLLNKSSIIICVVSLDGMIATLKVY